MSKPGLFNEYIARCFSQLEESLANYQCTCDNKLLFRFRVSIKKIRTCLNCIEYYEGKKKFRKTRKDLKEVFQTGGTLRELRIYDDWFKQNHFSRLAMHIGLPGQIKEKEEMFTGNHERVEAILKATAKTIIPAGKKLKHEQVYYFYLDMLHERLPLLLKRPPQNEWHKTRKQYKKILYARHWQDAAGLTVLSKRQAVFLDQLQHLIGYWHDNDMMIEWLKMQRASCTSTPLSRQLFRQAFDMLEEKSERYKKRVDHKFDQLPGVLGPLSRRLEKIDEKK